LVLKYFRGSSLVEGAVTLPYITNDLVGRNVDHLLVDLHLADTALEGLLGPDARRLLEGSSCFNWQRYKPNFTILHETQPTLVEATK